MIHTPIDCMTIAGHEAKQAADFVVENHVSICIFKPTDSIAREWLLDNTDDEAQWFGGGVVVEPRYLDGLRAGAEDDGFKVYPPTFADAS